MRIISTVEHEVHCRHCGTHFEFDVNDIYHKVSPPQYDEVESQDDFFVNCPKCGRKHNVTGKTTAFERKQVIDRPAHDYSI